MGQSGVEPNEKHPAVNAMWRNEPDRVVKAKDQARMARNRGEYLSAHSIMLSAYITALSGNPAEGRHPVKFFVLALWHAFCMNRRSNELSYNHLDVLIQFLIALRKKLPLFPFRPNLLKLAQLEIELVTAAKNSKPHQIALAYMTMAEVECIVYGRATSDLIIGVNRALGLSTAISLEDDQPQGLRQLVRIYRKAGELSVTTGDTQGGKRLLNKALDLARGKANTPDQVDKILAIITKL